MSYPAVWSIGKLVISIKQVALAKRATPDLMSLGGCTVVPGGRQTATAGPEPRGAARLLTGSAHFEWYPSLYWHSTPSAPCSAAGGVSFFRLLPSNAGRENGRIRRVRLCECEMILTYYVQAKPSASEREVAKRSTSDHASPSPPKETVRLFQRGFQDFTAAD